MLPETRFGDSPAMQDALAALVLAGTKTASCAALAAYGPGEPLPRAGDRFLVADGAGVPVCVIETVSVFRARFDEVSEEFAAAEGEGDRSLAQWRDEHRAFFTRAGLYAPDMMLVCERFRVVGPPPGSQKGA